MANSASELVAAVGAVAGGLLTLAVSLPTLFWLAIGFQFAALAIVLIAVDEPRKRSA